jgi:hypothetical protein
MERRFVVGVVVTFALGCGAEDPKECKQRCLGESESQAAAGDEAFQRCGRAAQSFLAVELCLNSYGNEARDTFRQAGNCLEACDPSIDTTSSVSCLVGCFDDFVDCGTSIVRTTRDCCGGSYSCPNNACVDAYVDGLGDCRRTLDNCFDECPSSQ